MFSYQYPERRFIDKKKYISLVDYYIAVANFEILKYPKQGQIASLLLFAMNKRKKKKEKQIQSISDVYEGLKTNDNLLKKWNKFIEKKRSRSIGYWCFANKNDTYKKLTKEEYRHEKEDSNFINIGADDKRDIVWMSDEFKQIWKSKHSCNEMRKEN